VQLLRSHRHLPVTAARVARPSASFARLSGSLAGVANSSQLSRGLAKAPLPLRVTRCSKVHTLLGNHKINYAPSAPDAAGAAHGYSGR